MRKINIELWADSEKQAIDYIKYNASNENMFALVTDSKEEEDKDGVYNVYTIEAMVTDNELEMLQKVRDIEIYN